MPRARYGPKGMYRPHMRAIRIERAQSSRRPLERARERVMIRKRSMLPRPMIDPPNAAISSAYSTPPGPMKPPRPP